MAATRPPANVTLSAEDIVAFPYAAHYLQVDQNPRVLMVLAVQAFGQDVYATADQRQIHLRAGRLLSTEGFPLNGSWLTQLPDPTAALNRRQPLCWQALWRATGSHTAANYLGSGCLEAGSMQAIPDGTDRQARLITELVRFDQVETTWVNRFWISSEGEVLYSEQRLGVNLPLFRLALVKPAPPPSNTEIRPLSEGPVAVTVSGVDRRQYAVQPQLSALLRPYQTRTDIDWASSTWFDVSPDQVAEKSAQRDALVAELQQALLPLMTRDPEQALTYRHLIRALEALKPARRIPFELQPLGVLLGRLPDRALKGSAYHLNVAAPPHEVSVVGAVAPFRFRPLQGAVPRPDVLEARLRLGAGARAMVLLANGERSALPLDASVWAARELPPGTLIVIGLADRRWDARLADVFWNSLP